MSLREVLQSHCHCHCHYRFARWPLEEVGLMGRVEADGLHLRGLSLFIIITDYRQCILRGECNYLSTVMQGVSASETGVDNQNKQPAPLFCHGSIAIP